VPCQYIRGQGSEIRTRLIGRSAHAQFVSRRFAGSPICDNLVLKLLPLVEGPQAGALDRTDVNKHILAAVIRLNEAEALLAVEPLNSARTHENILSLAVHTREPADEVFACLLPDSSILEKGLKRARPSLRAKRPSRSAN
jgi:hypothetical protein